MTTRTGFPASTDAEDGDVLDEAGLARLPGGCIGDIHRDSDVTGITTEQDITDLTLSVPVNSSRMLVIAACGPRVSSTNTGDIAEVYLYEDGNQVAACRIDTGQTAAGSNGGVGWSLFCTRRPSSGTRVYKVRGARVNGSGTISFRAGGTSQMVLTVTDVGPA